MFYLLWYAEPVGRRLVLAKSKRAAVETFLAKAEGFYNANVLLFLEADEIPFPQWWKEMDERRRYEDKITQFAHMISYMCIDKEVIAENASRYITVCNVGIQPEDPTDDPYHGHDCVCHGSKFIPSSGESWRDFYERNKNVPNGC